MARPEGSIVTTSSLLLKESKEWMKVNQRTRLMIGQMLDNFQRIIDTGQGDVEVQLKMLDGLKEIMLTGAKIQESYNKLTNDPESTKREDEDPDKILLELKGEK